MKTKEEIIKDRDDAISEARWILMNDYFVLDTETTGLYNAQMCQLALIKSDGTKYKSLVKPTIPIEEGATNVHHITNEDVEDAPIATEVVLDFPEGMMVIYNAPFDTKIIKQSLLACGIDYTIRNEVHDAMQIYSKFRGEWDDYHGNYRWHKLAVACIQCGIEGDGFHDALTDVTMTDQLLKYISVQKLSTEA